MIYKTSALLGLLAALTAVHASPTTLVKRAALSKREPPKALPENASEEELRYQPVMDFDTDSCYNTPAIDGDGNIAEGLSEENTFWSSECRDEGDLGNSNVYSRSRCNNGWCAYMYEYYFEKDIATEIYPDGANHRHDWENVVVFVQDGAVRAVAASQHGGYSTRSVDEVRMQDTHTKIVYHKDSDITHCFRFGREDDETIENHSGSWFSADLVGWNGYPTGDLRTKLMTSWKEPVEPKLRDDLFGDYLEKAMGKVVS